MHGISFLQAVNSSGLDTTGIASAGHTLKLLLGAILGVLLVIFVLMYFVTHLAGGVMHMWGGFPWAKKDHGNTGKELHDRAHHALMQVAIKAPIMIAVVALLAGIVATITGFVIPLDFKNAFK